MKAHEPAFTLPDDVTVENLTIGRLQQANSLKPTDVVICINRGRKPLEDKFDGIPTIIPSGLFYTEYGAALHFQRRLIVPGTRTLETGGHVSWIGIFGSEDRRIAVDPPEWCVPFTDAELQQYGERIEAIDRSALSNPADRDVTPIRMTAAMSGAGRAGGGLRPVVDASAQTAAAAEAAAHVFEPTTEPNLAKQDQAAALADGVGAGDEQPGAVPQPRPMRRR